MQNLISFLFFQIVSLGTFSLLSPFFKIKCDKDKIGTSIFWGFWIAMLLSYLFALTIPHRLNIACYLIFLGSLVGIGRLINTGKIREILKSNYVFCLFFLIPFVFFLVHKPSSCDEYGHWVLLPKIYVETNNLVTAAVTSGVGYTPLWALQAAFFEFLTPGNFSESVIATLKIGIFISFLFFLKETFKLNNLIFLLFSFFTLLIISKFNKHLVIEFPICMLIASLSFVVYALEKGEGKELLVLLLIGALSLYMVKKSMIAVLPSVLWYLWVKNYKKQLFVFLGIFCFFVISWKIKTYGTSELLAPGHTINSFSSSQAFLVYSCFFQKVKENFFYFLIFGISLYLFFRESQRLFIFYIIFSLIFIMALIVSYLFSFSDIEALKLASFLRYMSSVFYPAYVLALFILLSKILEKIKIQPKKIEPSRIRLGIAVLSFTIGASYFYQGYNESKRDYVGQMIAKIPLSLISQHENVLILGSLVPQYGYWRFRYHLYPWVQKLEFRSFDNLSDQDVEKMLSKNNLIIVRETNDKFNQYLKTYWGLDTRRYAQFLLYKKNNRVQTQKL